MSSFRRLETTTMIFLRATFTSNNFERKFSPDKHKEALVLEPLLGFSQLPSQCASAGQAAGVCLSR